MSSSSMKRLSQVKVARNNTGADQESAREVAKLGLNLAVVYSIYIKFILICLNIQQVTLSNPKVSKIPCMLSQSELIRVRSCLLYLHTDP